MPTFENVAREFITEHLYRMMFDEKLPNIRFEFREKEAMEFVQGILDDYVRELYLNEYKAESCILEEHMQKIFLNMKKIIALNIFGLE